MGIWAIVPVKPLRRGKSRLAGVLSENERAVLNYSMLNNTLKVLREVPEIEATLVISRDPSALSLARAHKARTVQEDGSPELNAAIRRATIVAQAYAAHGVLILPADLPLITSVDLGVFLSNIGYPPEIVIAPDHREDGTNALFISPPGLIDYLYGPGSFQRHLQQSEKFGIKHTICRLPSLGLDLDLPEDLEIFKMMENTPVQT
jgi:2-phospho-L-lactate guanylyltransferase